MLNNMKLVIIVRERIKSLMKEKKILVLNEDDFKIKVELEVKGFLTTMNGKFEASEGYLLKMQARYESYLDKTGEKVAQNILSTQGGTIVLQTDKIVIKILGKAIIDTIAELGLSPQAEKEAKRIIFASFNIVVQNYKKNVL